MYKSNKSTARKIKRRLTNAREQAMSLPSSEQPEMPTSCPLCAKQTVDDEILYYRNKIKTKQGSQNVRNYKKNGIQRNVKPYAGTLQRCRRLHDDLASLHMIHTEKNRNLGEEA